MLQGSSYTWSNNREKEAWVKLDRFLLSPDLLSWFPMILRKALPRSLLDHNPILISEAREDWGPIPFRFFNWWLEEKELMGEAIRGWKDCKVERSVGYALFLRPKSPR